MRKYGTYLLFSSADKFEAFSCGSGGFEIKGCLKVVESGTSEDKAWSEPGP